MKLRIIRWSGHAAHMEEIRNAYIILVGKFGKKNSTWKTRCLWENNIKIDWVWVCGSGPEWNPMADFCE